MVQTGNWPVRARRLPAEAAVVEAEFAAVEPSNRPTPRPPPQPPPIFLLLAEAQVRRRRR